jgi:3-mercaptopyruvate sulfurtransferase SseA
VFALLAAAATSARAVRILHKLGYRRIVELRGGMLAWHAAGPPRSEAPTPIRRYAPLRSMSSIR